MDLILKPNKRNTKQIGGNIYKEWMPIEYPKKINYKPEGRKNIRRPLTGRWFPGGRNRPRVLNLIVDDDDDLMKSDKIECPLTSYRAFLATFIQ